MLLTNAWLATRESSDTDTGVIPAARRLRVRLLDRQRWSSSVDSPAIAPPTQATDEPADRRDAQEGAANLQAISGWLAAPSMFSPPVEQTTDLVVGGKRLFSAMSDRVHPLSELLLG